MKLLTLSQLNTRLKEEGLSIVNFLSQVKIKYNDKGVDKYSEDDLNDFLNNYILTK